MLSIQSVARGGGSTQSQSFQGKHLPRKFSSMMNYLYKQMPDTFEARNSIRVCTIINGEEVSGTVNFLEGKYYNLVLDEGYENLNQNFMRIALERYKKHIMTRQLQEKLARSKY